MKHDTFRSTKHKLKGLRNSVSLCFENIIEALRDGADAQEILESAAKYRNLVDQQFLKTIKEFEENYLLATSEKEYFQIWRPVNISLYGIDSLMFIGSPLNLKIDDKSLQIQSINADNFLKEKSCEANTFYIFNDPGHIQEWIDFITQYGLHQKSVLVLSDELLKNIESQILSHEILVLSPEQLQRTYLRKNLTQDPIVLLDDDEIVRASWDLKAKRLNLPNFTSFETPAQLRESDFSPQTKFFLDSELGQGEVGEKIAQELYARGFRELYLVSGKDISQLEINPAIKKVCYKRFPIDILVN